LVAGVRLACWYRGFESALQDRVAHELMEGTAAMLTTAEFTDAANSPFTIMRCAFWRWLHLHRRRLRAIRAHSRRQLPRVDGLHADHVGVVNSARRIAAHQHRT
jgi:hypothetical protein